MSSHSQKRDSSRNPLVLWTSVAGVLLVIVIGVFLLASQKGDNPTPPPVTADKSDLLKVRQDDWVRGEMAAPVTLIEYADFQCPACAYYYSLVKRVEAEYPSKLRVVYRQFPLIGLHEHALEAAFAAEAAGQQGKFWEMHDMLFERQKEWSEGKDAKNIFTQYAKKIGLDEKRFVADMGSDELYDRLKKSAEKKRDIGVLDLYSASGSQSSNGKDAKGNAVYDHILNSLLGVEQLELQGTPTFFMNGKQIENPKSFEDFRYLIENEK